MATVITMPRLSPTMEEGVLAKWMKKEGEKIAPGDIIAEVETDKANMDFPLEDDGVLLKQLAGAGETIKLGAPVAILGDEGEDISELLAQTQAGGAAPTKSEAAPAKEAPKQDQEQEASEEEAEEPKAAKPAQAPAAAKPAQAPAPAKQPAPAAKAAPPAPSGARVIASPLARRLAGDAGVDIRQIAGSGPGGRVIKRDIEQALAATQTRPAAEAPAAPSAAAGAGAVQGMAPGDEVVPLSMLRRTVARRMSEAKRAVPHFYLTSEASVEALWQFREQLNRTLTAAGGEKVSVNDLVIKALARALRVVPAANMSIREDGQSAVRYGRVDISVAVAIEDGLITPVVRNADQKSVGRISQEVRELAARAHDKKLRPEEYQGGTFSITNLGMYGIREFFAIINPPEAGILAVGQVEKRPVVVERDGQDTVTVERRMTLTLSCDHRIIDGVLGAKLLAEVVRGLREPLLLVM